MTENEFIKQIKVSSKQLLPEGTSLWLSDWDILVLLNREGRATGKDYDEIGYPLNELFWQHGQDVNTIIQTRSEWQQKSFTPFYKNVMQDAIAL